MDISQSLVQRRGASGIEVSCSRFVLTSLIGLWMSATLACAPVKQYSQPVAVNPMEQPIVQPQFEEDAFVSFDGARLGLSVWEAASDAPEVVFVGVHGMNDYAGAFRWSAPWWAERGVTTYAYDQRGFGRSPHNGVWPEEELMREDLRTAVAVARARHPQARIVVIGVSMGGAVTMTAMASDQTLDADAVVLSGPGLRGWGALPMLYRASLWVSAHTRPSWVVTPPKRVARSIVATDNNEVLQTHWEDPHFQKTNRIDSVFGVVTVMENAHKAAASLPSDTPTLLLYGGRDQIVPQRGLKRTARRLPAHVRTAYYPDAYHMLLRDLKRETVLADILAFANKPDAALPSGVGGLPWTPDEPQSEPSQMVNADVDNQSGAQPQS